jgi:TIR domain
MNLKLFYSHAWADKAGAKVKKLLLFLQKDYEVWLDKKQIDLGSHINDTVATGIEKCDIFICVWSRNANDSKGVLFELETATRLNKPILVLLIENFDTAESPYLAGKEYIDFSGNETSFNQQKVFLQNFLLRKKTELFQQELSSPADKAAAKELTKKAETVQDLLIELEDTVKRQQINASGNDDSDVYVNSSLTAFEKILDTDEEEGKLMLRFSEKMKEISAKYPLQADDRIKKQLAIEAIAEMDPLGKNAQLAELKTFLEQDLGSKKMYAPQVLPAVIPAGKPERLLLKAYKKSVDKTRDAVMAKLKSPIDDIPLLNIFSSISKAGTEFQMSYITNSPAILEKMYDESLQSKNNELKMLITILIQHIKTDDLKKLEQTKQINAYMPYAYIINNTARLLVQAKAFEAEKISYSLVSSIGLDKLSKIFFKEDWKEKAENFLDMVKNNFGIEDKNLNWLKAAATVIGVALVAEGMGGAFDGSGEDSTSISAEANPAAAGQPVYFEDKMAAAGITMPNTVQY